MKIFNKLFNKKKLNINEKKTINVSPLVQSILDHSYKYPERWKVVFHDNKRGLDGQINYCIMNVDENGHITKDDLVYVSFIYLNDKKIKVKSLTLNMKNIELTEEECVYLGEKMHENFTKIKEGIVEANKNYIPTYLKEI